MLDLDALVRILTALKLALDLRDRFRQDPPAKRLRD